MKRNKGVWGEDAHVFDPARWLRGDMSKQVPVGVYGNLCDPALIQNDETLTDLYIVGSAFLEE